MHIFNKSFAQYVALHLSPRVCVCVRVYAIENLRKPNAHWRMHCEWKRIEPVHKVNSFRIAWTGNCSILLKNRDTDWRNERERERDEENEKE